MNAPRHYLSLADVNAAELAALIRRATTLREWHHEGRIHQPLPGKTLAMLFEKSSTRTRVSFSAGMAQLGGHALSLNPQDLQIGRGETLEDTARVVSSMVDAVMIRTHSQERLEQFAACSSVPVINGLSDRYHPCQLLADLQTWTAHQGELSQRTAAWIGDGNNVCHSFINAARLLRFQLRICCPEGHAPDVALLRSAGDVVTLVADPREAVTDVDMVVTDAWVSMGQESEQEDRLQAFRALQVTSQLMTLAHPEAIFMHCLPAHRGEEVQADVIDGAQSVVWEEAENRLHAQKALLEFLLLGADGIA